MEFPNPHRNGRPLIGQKEVPTINFQIQVTPELSEALKEWTTKTGLDGMSLMNHVFVRGLTAINQDLLNDYTHAEEERENKAIEEG